MRATKKVSARGDIDPKAFKLKRFNKCHSAKTSRRFVRKPSQGPYYYLKWEHYPPLTDPQPNAAVDIEKVFEAYQKIDQDGSGTISLYVGGKIGGCGGV